MPQHWQRKTITDEQMRDARAAHYWRLCPRARVGVPHGSDATLDGFYSPKTFAGDN